MKKEIKTRQQLIEKLNNIDRNCVDKNMHFYDLKTLYEAKEYKLSAKDKADIKKVASIEDDPDALKAYIDSKAVEESLIEEDDLEKWAGIEYNPEDYAGGYTEWDLIDSKKVPNRGRKKTEYNLWYNEFEDMWVCTAGDKDIYYPENVVEYEAEFEDEEEARKWFEDYLTEEYNNLDKSLSEDLGPRQRKELSRLIDSWNSLNINDALYTSTTMGRIFDNYLRQQGFRFNQDFICPPFQEGVIIKLSSKSLTDNTSLDESMLTNDEYDYFVVYRGEILQGEYPTYAEAKKNAGEGCIIKGVTQYGGNEFEETEIEESFNEEEPGFNDYLLQNYGITSDDLSDEDYDRAWNEFEQHISKEKNLKEDLAEENIHHEEVCNLEIDIDVSGLWGSDKYDEDRIWENLDRGDIIENLEKFITENTPEGVKFDIMDYDSEQKSMTAYLYIGLEEELDDSDIETLVFNIVKNWDYQERTYYEYSKGSFIRPQEFEISADVYAYAEVGKIYPYSEYR